MSNYKKDSTTMFDIVCAVIFVLIIFVYFYSFQGDILGMTQYSWSDHQTHYDRLTGGIIFTLIACGISALSALVFTLPAKVRAFHYMPAMVLSGMVTGSTVDGAGHASISWGLIIFALFLLAIYPYAANKLQKYRWLYSYTRDGSSYVTVWWYNILIMALLSVLMYGMGNTDRTLHTRLAVERLCHEGKYKEALEYGIPKYDHDEGLTMWRAYALAKLNDGKKMQMGERLFNYNIHNAKANLLPRNGVEPHSLLRDCYPVWQVLGFVPRDVNETSEKYLARELRRGTARSAAKDYLLCTYLMKKDLPSFAKELVKYYSDNKSPLPQHYAEALLIYKNGRNTSHIDRLDSLTVDAATIADYYDFQYMLHERKSMKEKTSDLKDNYFGTYWYYYFKK